jgi:hypothetical protein
MKRILNIILIVIVIAFVILIGAWLKSRNTATKNGTTPLSFREFITGKNAPASPTTNPDGSLGSVFTDTTPSTDTTEGGAPTIAVTTSTFTNTQSLNPSNRGASALLDPTLSPGGASSEGTSSGTTTGTDVITTVPGASTITSSGCTEADKNITFTADELSRLRALQNRFYQVATTLHTDADAAAELANYTTFRAEVDTLLELNTYCTTHVGNISDPTLKRRVPTPFWHDLAQDNLYGFFSTPGTFMGRFKGSDTAAAQRNLEHALRLNLW